MPDEKSVAETLETIGEKVTALSVAVETIDEKVTALSADVDARFADVDARFADVDARFAGVDKRFDEVSEAFVEQRKYTEFAFERLKTDLTTEMKSGFGRLDRKLDRVLETLTRTPPPRRRRRS
jgi:uncharacterized coiled-coil protein SlyX